MSTLTKVFVLLLSLVSIALSMLVVAAFAQQQNWREAAGDWQETALAAEAKARTVSHNAQLQHQRDLDELERAAESITALNGDKLDFQNRISELERTETDLSNKLAAEQAQVTSVSGTLSVVNASLNREQEYSRKLTQRNSETQRRNIDLNDRVQELTTNLEMASFQVRALQQQVTVMDEQQASIAMGLTPARQIPGGAGIVEARIPTVRPASLSRMAAPIRGQITEVNGNLASISVGSADGVVTGMTFLVSRYDSGKPSYLCTLRVDKVQANQSVGVIENPAGQIRPGDAARDEASFAMRY